jgi:hypothetical protein
MIRNFSLSENLGGNILASILRIKSISQSLEFVDSYIDELQLTALGL